MNNNEILKVINTEIIRINRAIDTLSESKGKDLTDEENRIRTKNLLTMSKQNLQSLALSLAKEPRFIEKMVNNTSYTQKFDIAISDDTTMQVDDTTCSTSVADIWDK